MLTSGSHPAHSGTENVYEDGTCIAAAAAVAFTVTTGVAAGLTLNVATEEEVGVPPDQLPVTLYTPPVERVQ